MCITKQSTKVNLGGALEVKVSLIFGVGYMVEGASGHMEEDTERMVKTPWFDEEIPFTKAAEIGTKKVINDHSTIGIVVTTDGSIGDIPRESYLEPEEATITELKKLNKPFVVIVNTAKPHSNEAKAVAEDIENKYNVKAMALNCEQLKREDVNNILENVLYEFPLSVVEFYMPKWVEMLPNTDKLKADIINTMKTFMAIKNSIRDHID